MGQHIRKFTGIISALALLLVCPDAMAGSSVGLISYAPLSSSAIPTLSGAMLVVLSFLFSVLAFRVLRARSVNKPLASIVAIGILTLGASSGIHLVRSAQAAIASIAFSVPSGGSVNIVVSGYETEVTNSTGQAQRITNISVNSGFTISSPPPDLPECIRGLVVPNQGHCYIDIVTASPG